MNAVPAPAAENPVSMLDHALAYARRGWPVFPCKPDKRKSPLTKHGFKDATTDEAQVEAWWLKWPWAAIGLATGEKSGVLVLDVDLPKPKKDGTPTADGREILASLEACYGDLPKTLESKTGSGGRHIFFKYPPYSDITIGSNNPGESLDFRGEGGYVILAPSAHYSGNQYEWTVDAAIADAPDWWLEDISKKPPPAPAEKKPATKQAATTQKTGDSTPYGLKALAKAFDKLASTSPGGRNAQLFREAASLSELVAGGEIASKVEVENTLMTAMDENGYISDDGESAARKTLNSGFSKGMQNPRTAPPKKARSKAKSGQADAAPKEGKASPQRRSMLTALDRLGGAENVIYAQKSFWRWSGKLWEQFDDLEVKRTIQVIEADNEKYTASFNDSVFKLVRNEVARGKKFEFDAESRDVFVDNGVLHYNGVGWDFRPHAREDYRTKLFPVAYDPQATAPRFEQFLDEVFKPDADKELKKTLLLECMGLTFWPDASLAKFMMLYGPTTRNGKSRVTRLLENMVGWENHSSVEPAQFSQRFQRGYLHKKVLNLVNELPAQSGEWSEDLKKIVSGDSITGEHKNQNPFTFQPTCKLWFTTNELPKVSDLRAIFERVILIPFNRHFAEKERDHKIDDKLAAEKDGVFKMALDAFTEVLKRGGLFTVVPECEEAKEKWRTFSNDVAVFLEEMLEPEKSGEIKILTSELYDLYRRWCEMSGIEKKKVLPINFFSMRMKACGAVAYREERARYFKGFKYPEPKKKGMDTTKKNDALD